MEKFPEQGASVPEGEARAEKREALYDRLRERIGMITGLRGELEREDIKGEEFVRNAEAKIDAVLERYRGIAAPQLSEKDRLIRISENIDAEIEKSDYDFSSPEVQKSSEENDRTRDRIAEIDGDPDVRLFSVLSGAKPQLRYKARRYEDFKKDPGAVRMPERISDLDIPAAEKETVFSSLSVSFLLDDGEMGALGYDRGVYGAHFEGDVFNVIRRSGDAEDEAESIRHENTHSVYEAFDDRPRADITKKKAAGDEFSRFLQAVDSGSEVLRKIQFDMLIKRAKRAVLSSKGELVANFDELRKGRLHTELAAFYEVKSYLNAVRRAFESSSNKRSGESKKTVLEYMDRYLAELQKEFDFFYSLLGDLFFVAEHEGKTEELKSAMILFDTGEYRKIARYLRHEIGDEKYEFYESLRRLVNNKFFSNIPGQKMDEIIEGEAQNIFDARDIVRATELIKANPEFLTPRVRQEIVLSLESLESRPSYIMAAASGVNECEGIYGAMAAFADAVGFDREYAESAIESLLNSALLDAVGGDRAKLEDALANLRPEHNETISRFVENYVNNEAVSEFGDEAKFKSSLLWKTLASNSRTREAVLRGSA